MLSWKEKGIDVHSYVVTVNSEEIQDQCKSELTPQPPNDALQRSFQVPAIVLDLLALPPVFRPCWTHGL